MYKILIVEDDQMIAQTLAMHLENMWLKIIASLYAGKKQNPAGRHQRIRRGFLG